MKRKILPGIVTGMEALPTCWYRGFPIIYIPQEVFRGNEGLILCMAKAAGYETDVFVGKYGYFFTKGVDASTCEVSDRIEY